MSAILGGLEKGHSFIGMMGFINTECSNGQGSFGECVLQSW